MRRELSYCIKIMKNLIESSKFQRYFSNDVITVFFKILHIIVTAIRCPQCSIGYDAIPYSERAVFNPPLRHKFIFRSVIVIFQFTDTF